MVLFGALIGIASAQTVIPDPPTAEQISFERPVWENPAAVTANYYCESTLRPTTGGVKAFVSTFTIIPACSIIDRGEPGKTMNEIYRGLLISAVLAALLIQRYLAYGSGKAQAAASALRDLVKSVRFETAPLVIELHPLAAGLDTCAGQGGNTEMAALYKNRYKAEIGALQLLEILSSEAVVRSFGAREASTELERSWHGMDS